MSWLPGGIHNVLAQLGYREEEAEDDFTACYLSAGGAMPVAWVRAAEVGWCVAVSKRTVPKLTQNGSWERLAEDRTLPSEAAFAVGVPNQTQLHGVLELIAHALVGHAPGQVGAAEPPGSVAPEPLAPSSPWETLESLVRDAEQGTVPAETVVRALRDIRVGQDRFRAALMEQWDSACAVTGLRVARLLRASHCKPWARSSNAERVDPYNGLLLAAHLDAAFDAGYIGFADDGAMIVSPLLTEADKRALDLRPDMRLRRTSSKNTPFLAWHRAHIFLTKP